MGKPTGKLDRLYARASYDSLVVLQPHVKTEGLWRAGDRFFIVCPELAEARADEGQSITEWFANNKVAGSPVWLVDTVPSGGTFVPPRTAEELAEGVGDPRNLRDALAELVLRLPRTFPDFDIYHEPPDMVVTVERDLTIEESGQLDIAVTGLGTGTSWRVDVDANRFVKPRKPVRADLRLIPSKLLPNEFGKEFRWQWEEDEDFWAQHRVPLLAHASVRSRDALTTTFAQRSSACLVHAPFVQNIRTYLPLYKRTILVMPIAEHLPVTLSNLRATADDLLALAQQGRLQFLLPQSPARYDSTLIHRLANEVPSAMLLSRRLAAATIADMQRRGLPQYPPLGISDRSAILRLLAEGVERIDQPIEKRVARAALAELKKWWSWGHAAVQVEGAHATLTRGSVGSLFAAMLEAVTGKNVAIELSAAAGDVQWAGTLGATVFPASGNGYSAQAATELCAGLYAGVQNVPIPTNFGDVKTVLEGVLGIDSEAPVEDVASAFDGDEVDALRAAVHRIAEPNLDPDFLHEAIKKFNARVRSYEAAVARQAKWDVRGGAAAVATLVGAIGGGPEGMAIAAGAVPVGSWLLDRIANVVEASPGGARMLDRLRAANAITSSDVVLVSRLRS